MKKVQETVKNLVAKLMNFDLTASKRIVLVRNGISQH